MDGPVTWQSVRSEALRRIRTRAWYPGGQIPHEADLAAEFGCARATVNRALRELANEGLLERRRKGGTRVSLTPIRKATFDIAIIRQDIEGRSQTYGYQLLSDRRAPLPQSICSKLNLSPPEPWRAVCALHLANGAPFCLESRWINPALVGEDVQFDTISANEWLVRNLAYSGGDFIFYAKTADSDLVEHLQCPPNSALFAIDRTTFSDQHPITAVTLTYAPGYKMISQI